MLGKGSMVSLKWRQIATEERKRLITGSSFPEKLTFDGKGFQTKRLDEGARLIYTLNAGFSERYG